jgi:hypothetical protein
VRNSQSFASLDGAHDLRDIDRIDASLRTCDDIRVIYKGQGCSTAEDAAKKLAKQLALMQLVLSDMRDFDEVLRPLLLDTDSAACTTNKSRTIAPSLCGAAQFVRIVRKLVDTQTRLGQLPDQEESEKNAEEEKPVRATGTKGPKEPIMVEDKSEVLEKRLAKVEAALKKSEERVRTAESALENSNALSDNIAPDVLKDAFDQLMDAKRDAEEAHGRFVQLKLSAEQVVSMLEEADRSGEVEAAEEEEGGEAETKESEGGGEEEEEKVEDKSIPAAHAAPALPKSDSKQSIHQVLLGAAQSHLLKLQRKQQRLKAARLWQQKELRQGERRRAEQQRQEQQEQDAHAQQQDAELQKQSAQNSEQRQELRSLRSSLRKLERQLVHSTTSINSLLTVQQGMQQGVQQGVQIGACGKDGSDPCKARIDALQAEHTREVMALQRVVDEREMQIASLKVRASAKQMRRDMRARVEDEDSD